MKQILLTLDYELFGNGTGDVFKHIIFPTEYMLQIAQKYEARFTFFFEVIEYWHIKEEWENGNNMGYDVNPVRAMEDQIRDAVKHGHDVQLHLHPQWIDAYWQDGKWHVSEKDWRLGDYDKDGEYSLKELFARGKKTLENIIQPIKPDYVCNSIRAGGYCVQPSEQIVKVMRETGFQYDSSVCPGGFESGRRQFFDYTRLPDNIGHWCCGNSVEDIVMDSNIVELPIVVMDVVRLRKYMSVGRAAALLKNPKAASETFYAKISNTKKQSKIQRVRNRICYFFNKECQTWDYCLLSKSLHKEFIRKIESQKNRNIYVLVGHPKSLYDGGENFDWLLKQMKGKNYTFTTINDASIKL